MKNEPLKPNKFGGLISCRFFLFVNRFFYYGSNLVAPPGGVPDSMGPISVTSIR